MSNNIDLDVNKLHRTATNDAYEFPIWGTIVGEISNQDDLQAILDAKAGVEEVDEIRSELKNFIKWSELAGRIQLVSASQANEDNRFHATIQKGIDAAREGDLVLIWDDIYNEPELFVGKHNLSLVNIAPVQAKHGIKLVGDLSVQASGTYIKGFNISGKTMIASTGTETIFDDCRLAGDATITGQGYIRFSRSHLEGLNITTNLYADVHVLACSGSAGKRWELNSDTANLTLESCFHCGVGHYRNGKVMAFNCEFKAPHPDGYNIVSTADQGHIFLFNSSTRGDNAVRGKVNKTGNCDYQFSTLDFNRAESILTGKEIDPDFYITDYYTKEEINSLLSALDDKFVLAIQNLNIRVDEEVATLNTRIDGFETETEQKFEAERAFVESEVSRLDGRIETTNNVLEETRIVLDGKIIDVDNRLTDEANRLDGRIDDTNTLLEETKDLLQGEIGDVNDRLTNEANRLDGRIDQVEANVSENVDALNQKIDDLSDSTDERFAETGDKLAELEEKKVPWFEGDRILLDNHRNLLGLNSTKDEAVNIAMVSQWDIVDLGSSKLPLNLNSSVKPTVQYPGETGEEAHPIALMDDLDERANEINETISQLDERLSQSIETLDNKVDEEVSTLNGRIDTLKTETDEKFTEERAYLESEVNRLDGRIDDTNTLLEETKVALEGEIENVNDRLTSEASRLDGRIDQVEANVSENVDALNQKIGDLADSTDERFTETGEKLAELEEKKVPWFDGDRILLDNHRNLLGWNKEKDNAFNLAMVSEWNVADFGSSKLPLNLNSSEKPTVQYPGEAGEDAHPIALMDDLNERTEEIKKEIQESVEQLNERIDDTNTLVEENKNELEEKITAVDNRLTGEAGRLDGRIDELETNTSGDISGLNEKIDNLSESTDERFTETGEKLAEMEEGKVPWFDGDRILLDNHRNLLGWNSTKDDAFNLAMVSQWDVADFGSSKLPMNLNSKVKPTVQYPGESGDDAHPIALMDDLDERSEEIREEIKDSVGSLKDSAVLYDEERNIPLDTSTKLQYNDNNSTYDILSYKNGTLVFGSGNPIELNSVGRISIGSELSAYLSDVEAVSTQVNDLTDLKIQIVNELPEDGVDNVIYLVNLKDQDYYAYHWSGNDFIRFGVTDLSDYYTRSEVDNKLSETSGNFENYYTKSEVDNSIDEVSSSLTSLINEGLSEKQNVLSPGENIHIEGDIISADMYDDTSISSELSELKEQTDQSIAGITEDIEALQNELNKKADKLSVEVVEELPETGVEDVLYLLIPSNIAKTVFEKWRWNRTQFVSSGTLSIDIDLSLYATREEVNTLLSGKVNNSELSNYLRVDGNAASATKLNTSRSIWGQSFDGTGNVSGSLAGVTSIDATVEVKAPTFIGNLQGNASTATTATNATNATNAQSATTAERLQTARKINGIDFNGSADITVPIKFSGITTLSSLSNINIATNYDQRISVSSNQTISFAATTDGAEAIITIRNTASNTITITLPTGTTIQSDESSLTIDAGRIAELSVRYIYSKYVIRIIGG